VSAALVGVIAIFAMALIIPAGKAERHTRLESEANTMASRIMTRIVDELHLASGNSIVHSAAAPGTISFRKGEVDLGTGDVILGQPTSIRAVRVPGTVRLGVELVQQPDVLDTYFETLNNGINDDDGLIPICHLDVWDPASGTEPPPFAAPADTDPSQANRHEPETVIVPLHELPAHLAHGDIAGACATPPIWLGAGIAPVDPDDPALPGLHFAVREGARGSLVDVTLTVEVPDGQQPVRRTLTTTVRTGAN
jgi:hypothetical protein